VIAAVLAVLFLLARRDPGPKRHQVPALLLVAATSVAGFPLMSAYALVHVDASHASVLIGFIPIATAILGAVRAGERPPPAFWAASAFGSFVVLAFAFGNGDSGPNLADAWLVVASLVSAVGYAEGARLARDMGGFRVIAWALVFAAAPLGLLVLASPHPSFAAAPVSAWIGLVYVAVISMFFAFMAWYAGLAGAGIARGSQLQLAQPFLSVLWATLLIGETPSPRVWFAASAVVVSIAAATRARKPPSPHPLATTIA
jgi:drug/metabolite transporter (DMT)-like permease